jgi:hypothetical protein
MGCLGKARNFDGDVEGEVSFGVQVNGEEVNGQENVGKSVDTVIDFAGVLMFLLG